MALVTVQRSPSSSSICDDAEGEEEDQILDLVEIESPKRPPKLGRMRSPSFEGYFASKSGAFALSDGILARSESTKPCGELQFHLQRMVTLLRSEDILRMAVRLESQVPEKKRYLALVTDAKDSFSAVLGIDWIERPTIGLILPIYSSSNVYLDGDGGFHITSQAQTFMFKPVSVQMLWSAIHVTHKAIEVARRKNYFPGGQSHVLVAYYNSRVNSDHSCVMEWNLLEGLESVSRLDLIFSEQEEKEQQMIKKLIRMKLKEVMLKVDLDDVTSKEIRMLLEEQINMDLTEYKEYVDTEMLTILGQMDSASKILDYLYLGSEWNASNYDELMEMGIGYVLNVTREIDNFFPGSFDYYNVRVWDEEEAELLHHWDHTFRFINQAREAGSKVLVHCRMGISRSASTVIAYLMKAYGWSLTQSIEHVRTNRNIIQPNPGFQKQLIVYEGILNSSRNRFSALFRQRSKVESKATPTLRQKRQMFKKSRSSREVEDEEVEEKKAKDKEPDSVTPENVERPKSWGGTPSLREIEVAIDAETEAGEAEKENIPEKTVSEVEEPSQVEHMEVDAGKEPVKENTEQSKRRARLSQRAKTLPTGVYQGILNEEEEMETVSELPRVVPHGRRGHLKRQVTDADLDSLISEDAKEENESMMKQAFMACEIKSQLMRSLEMVGRITKHKMDEEFSVESIVKPSSLRKLSKTRRLSVERRTSLSEQDRPPFFHRQRSYTEVSPRVSLGEDEDVTMGEESREKSHTMPQRKTSRKSLDSQLDERKQKAIVSAPQQELASLSFADDTESCDSDVFVGSGSDRLVTSCVSDKENKSSADQLPEKSEKTESRKKAFLRRSRTNIKEDSRRRTLDEKQLRKGLGELFKSRDVQKEGVSAIEREEFVINASQFSTVEESKKRIEERVRQHNIRSLRSPRRRTVGESELRQQRKREESGIIATEGDCKFTECPTESTRQTHESTKAEHVFVMDPADELPSPGRVRRNARNYESVSHDKPGKSTTESERTEHHVGETEEKLLPKEDALTSDRTESSTVDDDVSVRELVKLHSEMIRQISTSPSSSGSPTEGSPPHRSSPPCAEAAELDHGSASRNPVPFAPAVAESVPESSNVKSFHDESLTDPALKGFVKRQMEAFSAFTKASEPTLGPVPSKRRVHTLPRGKRPFISAFKSFEDPAHHKPVSRGKSLPVSKSESEIDVEVERILKGSDNTSRDAVQSPGEESTCGNTACKMAAGSGHLPVPESNIGSKSAPPSPDRSRRETSSDSLKDRAYSLDSLPYGSENERDMSVSSLNKRGLGTDNDSVKTRDKNRDDKERPGKQSPS